MTAGCDARWSLGNPRAKLLVRLLPTIGFQLRQNPCFTPQLVLEMDVLLQLIPSRT